MVQVCHVHREANTCIDALAKWGNHQQQLLTNYDICSNFVYHYFIRDMAGLLISRVCPSRANGIACV